MTRELVESEAGRTLASGRGQRPEPSTRRRSARLIARLATGGADALSGRLSTRWTTSTSCSRRIDEIRSDDLYVPRLRPADRVQ